MPDPRLRGALAAAVVMVVLLLAAVPAEARGGRWQGARDVIPAYAGIQTKPHVAPPWIPAQTARLRASAGMTSGHGGSDPVAVAERFLGSGNFTGLPGAWCAWAVSAWLRATGHRPLANGLAASALAYGPLELHPRRGDLVVMRTRRGRAGHVGLVVADFGATIEIVSGNWRNRVARSRIPRRSVTAFVRV